MPTKTTPQEKLEVEMTLRDLSQLSGGEVILDLQEKLDLIQLQEATTIIISNLMDYIFVGLKEQNPLLASELFELINKNQTEQFFESLAGLLASDPNSNLILEKGLRAGYFAVKNRFGLNNKS
jgi:hypothetical protein